MDTPYRALSSAAIRQLRLFTRRASRIPHHVSRFTFQVSRFRFHVSRFTTPASRIKRLPHHQVEIVNSQRELSISAGGFFVQLGPLKPPGYSPEADAERHLFILVCQRAEQAPDLLRPPPSRADQAQGRGRRSPAGFRILEQNALELAAILRTIRINPAPAAVQGRAGLRKPRGVVCRAWQGDRQPKRPQPLCIVPRLQLDVSKNDPVAAQAARQAKLPCVESIGVDRTIQFTWILDSRS